MEQIALSQLKPIKLKERMKLVNPASPPANAELEIKPIRIVTLIGAVAMIAAGLFVKATRGSGIWDPAISPRMILGISVFLVVNGTLVLAFAMFSRHFRDGIGFANFVALMPGSVWRLLHDKAEFIRRLEDDAAAFDADLASAAQSGASPEAVEALAERRKALAAVIDHLTSELLGAVMDDEKREDFLRDRAYGKPHSPSGEAVMADLAKQAYSDIMAAGAELGIKPGLLARHVAYLKRRHST